MKEFVAEFHKLEDGQSNAMPFHTIKSLSEQDMIILLNDKIKEFAVNNLTFGKEYDITYYETGDFISSVDYYNKPK